MAIEPITTSGPSVSVSTSDELREAYLKLSSTPGGGTITVDGDGGPYSFWFYKDGGGEPVIIKSADSENPAHFETFNIRDEGNIRIENVYLDSTEVDPKPYAFKTFSVYNCDNIQIVDSHFVGSATGPALSTEDRVDSLGNFRWSDDILFSGNTVENYFHGVGFLDGTNIEVADNSFTHMQGDGIRFGGVQDVLISDNYFGDFYSSLNSVNHPDMIQFWGKNASQLTQDVTIANNVFDNGDGNATQTIFIRNDKVDTDFVDNYKNITITNNLIYNGSLNGISLADIDGLTLTHNTLLWNKESTLAGSEVSTQAPKIIVRDSVTGVYAEGNIAEGINLPEGSIEKDNYRLNYGDPDSPNYVGNHFVNAATGGDLDLGDLRLLPESDWVGAGATYSQPMAKTEEGVDAVMRYSVQGSDIHEITFDAIYSIDTEGRLTEDEYDFRWEFGDGGTMEGISVTRTFPDAGTYDVKLSILKGGVLQDSIAREASVASKDIFEIDFEGGVIDLSDNEAIVGYNGDGLVAGKVGTGFQLDGDDNSLNIHRDNPEINDLKAFGLSMDLRLDSSDGSGDFLSFNKVMDAGVTEDRAVQFTLQTDEGTFTVKTAGGVIDVGSWHRIGFAFDDDAGSLGIYIDGELAAETEARGETGPRDQNMVFGEVFGRSSAKATLDNLVMTKDTNDVGELTVRPKPPSSSSDDTTDSGGTIEPVVRGDGATSGNQSDASSSNPESSNEDGSDGEADNSRPGVRVLGESKNFLSKLIDMILKIFGLGSDEDADQSEEEIETGTEEPTEVRASLLDLIPVTGTYDDDLAFDDDDDDDLDVAA